MAWTHHGHGMASVNQTRPHCVNRMGKTHSKPLAARHGRGTAWARHGHGMLMCESALNWKLHGGEWSALRPGRFIPKKESRHPLNKGLGGHQSLYGRFGKDKNLFSLTGFEPRIVYPVAYALYRPSHRGSIQFVRNHVRCSAKHNPTRFMPKQQCLCQP
jgi:hypothetical protein